MSEILLRTKLFVPPLRPNLVQRPHLVDKLNQGLQQGCKLSLISAPAGFGKTTLASEWVVGLGKVAANKGQFTNGIAWLSLDENDNDLMRFLSYLVEALNHVEGMETNIGERAAAMLQSPQPAPAEPVLTSLLNDITGIPGKVILVLDDYHLIDSSEVDAVLTFLIDHLPPQLHLAVATRDDPHLPLARLRARGHLTELRAADLRFTSTEAAKFLNQMMGLALSDEDIAALESRTEGWIAGLQLAALALQGSISRQGQEDTAGLIEQVLGIFFSLGALFFYYLLYQLRLVPRWIIIWGLIAVALVLTWNLLEFVGITVNAGIVFGLPIILNEIFLGIWLIAKGFNSFVVDSDSAKADNAEVYMTESM